MTHPLQTKQWGDFRKDWGNGIEFVKNQLIVFSKIPYTKYTIGTVLKGPDIKKSDLNAFNKIAKEKNCIFIKFEPNVLFSENLVKKYRSFGLVRGKKLFTPTTFVVDLTKSEEDLLSSFSSKTRYNIRLAKRKGVKVDKDNSDKAFNIYLKLAFDTAKRQGFYAHTKKYHRLMWKHLKGEIAHLLVATYKNEIITTWILFENDKTLYYPYGASSNQHRNVMANNLMMWEAIKFGKSLGCKSFDLWGREEGKGFTRFKEGYNPKVIKFVGSWDLVTNKPLYYIYQMAEKIRWLILRLKTKIF